MRLQIFSLHRTIMYTDGQTEFLPGPLDVCFDVAKTYPPLISIIFIWKIEKIEVRLKGNCCLLTFTRSSLAEERNGGGPGVPINPRMKSAQSRRSINCPQKKVPARQQGKKRWAGLWGEGGGPV